MAKVKFNCKKNCRECKHWGMLTASRDGSNYIAYAHECKKYGVVGESFKELLENVKWEFENGGITGA